MSPRYKDAEWEDESYDAIEYLIDNDPIELGKLYRRALAALRAVKADRPSAHSDAVWAQINEVLSAEAAQ